MTYRRIEIIDWDKHFEVSQTRRTANTGAKHHWVAIPNKHDGRGYARIAAHKDGPDIFAAWILMIQLASKMPTRGVFADDDGPLTLDDIAIKTRFPVKIFEKALPFLSSEKIGWVRVCGNQYESAQSALIERSEYSGSTVVERSELHDMTLHDTTGHDNTSQDNIVPATPKPSDAVNEVFNYWATVTGHTKAKLDPKRTKLINVALKLGYTVADLKQAIDGCKRSPFHQGRDGKNTTVYDSLELILRDGSKIDSFIGMASGIGSSLPAPRDHSEVTA